MSTPSPNDALAAKLITAANQIERIADLKDTDFVFNFLNHTPSSTGRDGEISALSPAIFPALLTGNTGMTVGHLGPCGLNTPHHHPRGTELNINIGGGNLQAEFIMENTARVISNTLSPGMVTVFPRGAIHFEQNLGCTPVAFVAAFDFNDPGTSQSATNLFRLDKDVLSATFNDIGVKFLDELVIPPAVALGAQSCFDRCHIDRRNFNFTGTFADFFDSVREVKKPADHYPPMRMAGSGPNSMAQMISESFSPSQNVSFSQNPLQPAVMGLSVALVALIILQVFMAITGKRRQLKAKRNAQQLEDQTGGMVKSPLP